jgi:hypothetical protein
LGLCTDAIAHGDVGTDSMMLRFRPLAMYLPSDLATRNTLSWIIQILARVCTRLTVFTDRSDALDQTRTINYRPHAMFPILARV